MKRYKEYFTTNSDFVPEIPTHWKKLRVKNLVDKNQYYPVGDGGHGSIKPEMYIEEGVPYIRVQNLSWTGELLLDNVVYISEEVQKANSKSILRPSDILIAKTGATVGKLGLIPNEIKEANTTSSVGKVTVDISKYNPKYILYSFQAKHFNDQIWMQASQKSAQPGFNIDDLIEFEIASPELKEQTQIAAFLDYKTNLIDATIEKKKRLIELLKEKRQAVINEAVTKGLDLNVPMKDSGILSLGEIPMQWISSKVKYVSAIQGRIGFKGYTKDDLVMEGEGALTLGAKHIDKENNINLSDPEYISWDKYYESPEIMVKIDDVIFTQRGSLGKVCHINEEIGKATINPSMVILTPKNINPRFLYFWLCSSHIQEEVELLQANTAVPMISQFQLSNFPIVLPSTKEQDEIVNYIDNSLTKFKSLIDSCNISVEKLQTYRQSLISEAVTGKIDVRDWQPLKNS